jgi:signal transduction histidine kinase/ActR/RegA family two-component response regulator
MSALRQSPDLGAGCEDPPELLRDAETDLIARLLHGIVPYVILLAIVGFTTNYRPDHASAFWSFAAAIGASIGIRIALHRLRQPFQHLRYGLRQAVVGATVALASVAAGLLHASALWWYGYESWPYVITMLWIVGCASGSTVSFTPDFQMLKLYLCTAWAPVFCVALWLGGKEGYTVALTTAALFAFLMAQGRGMHKAYWLHLRGRAVESARTRELEIAKIAAEQASLAKSQFLANMSHEIRTPMHGVLGMARLALESETLRESRLQVETLRATAEGLLQVINDVLDFSKIEAGKMTLEHTHFSVSRMLEELRKMLAPQAGAKGLRLECRAAGNVPDVLVGDPARLRQVLVNLLGNAVKFTLHGSVGLEVTRVDREPSDRQATLQFRISDTGIGIPIEQQQTIFEAFGQADSSVTRRFGGTGLGLTICSQLVELMGGRISVESLPGAGSTFQFTCAAEIGTAESLVERTAETVEERHDLRVLLAEDNPVNQEVATALLARHGHLVTVVSTGSEALETWESKVFDVVLTDNQMPVMGGIELVQRIREREAATGRTRTPVVALSASVMIGDRERFLAAGMDAFLAKPFSPPELYLVLRQVVAPRAQAEPILLEQSV